MISGLDRTTRTAWDISCQLCYNSPVSISGYSPGLYYDGEKKEHKHCSAGLYVFRQCRKK